MAQVIKPKTGTTTPTTGNLVDKEMAVDLAAQKLYVRDGGTVKEIGASGVTSPNTSVRSTAFTATVGEHYFCNTSSAAFTATLPSSPTAGDVVGFADYTGTWATNNLTIGRNSSNIVGSATDLIMDKNWVTVRLIYIDSTEGWIFV